MIPGRQINYCLNGFSNETLNFFFRKFCWLCNVFYCYYFIFACCSYIFILKNNTSIAWSVQCKIQCYFCSTIYTVDFIDTCAWILLFLVWVFGILPRSTVMFGWECIKKSSMKKFFKNWFSKQIINVFLRNFDKLLAKVKLNSLFPSFKFVIFSILWLFFLITSIRFNRRSP